MKKRMSSPHHHTGSLANAMVSKAKAGEPENVAAGAGGTDAEVPEQGATGTGTEKAGYCNQLPRMSNWLAGM